MSRRIILSTVLSSLLLMATSLLVIFSPVNAMGDHAIPVMMERLASSPAQVGNYSGKYAGQFTNPSLSASGSVVLDISITSSAVSGYINFTNNPNSGALCGAGNFSGTRNGDTIQFSFTSSDSDPGCTWANGLVFNVSGVLSGNQIVNGVYTVSDGENGVFSAMQTTPYTGRFTTLNNRVGSVSIDLASSTTMVAGFINFTNDPGAAALCGAGSFVGTRNVDSIQFSFLSNDPDTGCTFDKGLVFNISGTVSGNQLSASYAIPSISEGGSLSATAPLVDTTAPTAPSNLIATLVTQNSVSMSWNDNSSNEGGFKVYRWDAPVPGWFVVGTLGANSTNFTATGLTCNTQYTFNVNAYNNYGETPAPSSGWLIVTTSACNQPPVDTTSPDGSITAPLNGQTIDSTTLTFSAVASDNPGGSGVAQVKFNVYYDGGWHSAGIATTSPYYVRWSPPVGLASQQLQFTIHVIDNAGNQRTDAGGIRLINFKANASVDNGFKLPYPGGVGYTTTQGNNNNTYSHNGKYAFSFDFGMPRRSAVVASRNGRVTYVKGNSTTGGCKQSYLNDANLVIIKHLDGTQTLYAHLDSVSVRNGDTVARGQEIGRSGQTGWSCGAHLHFDRRKSGSSWTIATSFLDVAGGVPREGSWYTSGNYVGLASDTVEPIGEVRFSLTGTTPYTISLLAEDDTTPLNALEMRLAESEAGLSSAAWQLFTSEITWDKTTVWVQYRDGAGNISASYADTLDPVATSAVTAAFTTTSSVCANAEVPITNQTTPFATQYQWNWDLGNGVTSIAPDVAPTTYSAGTYTITLQVTGASNSSTATRQVNVLPAPDAAFTLIRNGNTITVTSNEADATAWTWDFGDGATATGHTTTHTYTSIATGDAAPVIRATVQGANGCSSNDVAAIRTSRTYIPLVVR